MKKKTGNLKLGWSRGHSSGFLGTAATFFLGSFILAFSSIGPRSAFGLNVSPEGDIELANRKGAAAVDKVFVDRSLDPSGSRAIDREILRSRLSERVQSAHEEKLATSSQFDRQVKPAAKPKYRARKKSKRDRYYSISRGFSPRSGSTRQLEIKRIEDLDRELETRSTEGGELHDSGASPKVIVLDSLE